MSHIKLRDTDPDAHRVHIDLMRRAEGWRKLQLADQLHQSLRIRSMAASLQVSDLLERALSEPSA